MITHKKWKIHLCYWKMRTSLSISKTKMTILGLSDFQERSKLQIADTGDFYFSWWKGKGFQQHNELICRTKTRIKTAVKSKQKNIITKKALALYWPMTEASRIFKFIFDNWVALIGAANLVLTTDYQISNTRHLQISNDVKNNSDPPLFQNLSI